jgi:phosphatidylglycerophosphatase A
MRNKLVLFFASGLGLGYAPIAPGTFGTLLGVALYFFLGRINVFIFLALLLALLFASFWLADQAEQILFSKDPQMVVIDEVVGYLVTMISFPAGWQYLLAGFFLFRFFDVTKIWPASYFDRSGKRGFAVVMDDVCAGVYANLVLQVLRMIFHWS